MSRFEGKCVVHINHERAPRSKEVTQKVSLKCAIITTRIPIQKLPRLISSCKVSQPFCCFYGIQSTNSSASHLSHHDNNKVLFFYLIIIDNLCVFQNFACNETEQTLQHLNSNIILHSLYSVAIHRHSSLTTILSRQTQQVKLSIFRLLSKECLIPLHKFSADWCTVIFA